MLKTDQSISTEERASPLLMIAFFSFILLGMAGGLLNIAWRYMQTTFHVELDQLGVLLLFATVGSLIAAFGSGALIGRYGVGRVLLMGTLAAMLGLAGFALVPSWVLLLIVTFFMYTGRGTLDAGMNNFVSTHYGSAAMNWLHASWGIGLTIAPAVITFLIVTLDASWRVAYALMAGIMLLLFTAILFTLPQWSIREKQSQKPDEAPTPNISPFDSLFRPAVMWSIALFFIYGGIEIGTGQLTNTLLVERRGIIQEKASLWISLYWGSFTVGRMLVGVIALRLADRSILRISMGLAVLGSAILIVPDFAILNLLGLMLIGSGLAAIFPILIAQTPARVGREHAPNAIGFQVGFAGLGAAVLPGIASFLAERFDLEMISYVIFLNALGMFMVYQWIVWREDRV